MLEVLDAQTAVPADLARLDPQETSEGADCARWARGHLGDDDPEWDRRCRDALLDVPPLSPGEEAFRHSGWTARRALTLRRMMELHLPARRIERFRQCGSGCLVEWSPTLRRHRVRAHYCHDRWCIPCQVARSKRLAAALRRKLEGGEFRFVTLTLRARTMPLAQVLVRLRSCWTRLRSSREFREHCSGGAAFLEVKIGANSGLWHAHLHLIAQGKYWAKSDLSRCWLAITGDSDIVDIQRVQGASDVPEYVTKYASKPMDMGILQDADRAQELMTALRGVRTCSTFGAWRGIELDDGSADPQDWQPVASLDKVLAAADAGEPWALAVLQSLRGDDDRTPAQTAQPPP